MWGDRLLDAKAMKGGEWEYAKNGTAGAVDLIPKDIVICDWHYEKQANYPSVPFLLAKGFRVWPSSWQPLAGAKAFSAFSREQKSARLVGFLCTVWGKVKIDRSPNGRPWSKCWPSGNSDAPDRQLARSHLRIASLLLGSGSHLRQRLRSRRRTCRGARPSCPSSRGRGGTSGGSGLLAVVEHAAGLDAGRRRRRAGRRAAGRRRGCRSSCSSRTGASSCRAACARLPECASSLRAM